MSKPRLLFVSNLFPDQAEPYRGLDNATLLHHLLPQFEIRAISPRPALFARPSRRPRDLDQVFEPVYVNAAYVPKFGSYFNHRFMACALRGPLEKLRAIWPYDVVLSSWIYPDSCAIAALAGSVPFVSIAQGSDVHQYLQMPARRRIILDSMRHASGIVTRSAALAQLLAEAGLPKARLHPIYNGIDFNQFQPGDPSVARRELGLPESGPVLLFVGNLVAIKNPLLLLQAHARLSGAHLVLVGGGSMEKQVRELALTLGTAGRITFAGRRSAPEVARFMQASDVLALPSWNEGVPNVILEAFACGLPVVASRVGGIGEVHDQSFLGRLVKAGDLDELTQALGQVTALPTDREMIRRHALRFSWENAAQAYTEVLQRCCQ
ncbi:MAG: glycosyltransferase [Verrucomicrobiota bacterium]